MEPVLPLTLGASFAKKLSQEQKTMIMINSRHSVVAVVVVVVTT